MRSHYAQTTYRSRLKEIRKKSREATVTEEKGMQRSLKMSKKSKIGGPQKKRKKKRGESAPIAKHKLKLRLNRTGKEIVKLPLGGRRDGKLREPHERSL